MRNLLKTIQLGSWLEWIIKIITFNTGDKIALFVAKSLGYQSCFCCERKQWLNRLTNKDYNGRCNEIKL